MALEVIILAAGQGARMKSDLPKVLHPIGGKPMLQHIVETAQALLPQTIHIVIGHSAAEISTALSHLQVNWVIQTEQLGTGHAVMQALPVVDENSDVLVLVGDAPVISVGSLNNLLQQQSPALLTAVVEDTVGLGRIVRNIAGDFTAVVEHKDASDEQRTITEISAGVIKATAKQLKQWLPQVENNNQQGEYYLPDILSLAIQDNIVVNTARAQSAIEVRGVNDKAQLNQAERALQRRLAEGLMAEGVTLVDAGRIDIRGSLTCGKNVFIDINAVFEGEVVLADNVHIGPNCVLKNAELGESVIVEAFCHLENARAEAGARIGPYARLRPGTQLGENARVGNFVETKNASLGAHSKANHLAYIGDSEVGAGANIGAGAITCNYDGANKHKTTVGDGAFIGSNATLVAPVKIRDGAFVGAGSTITREVGEEELAVSRARQRNIKGWSRPEKE